MNTALVSIIETLKNIPAKVNLYKDLIKKIVGIREDITTMKEKLRSEQQQIAKKLWKNQHLPSTHK